MFFANMKNSSSQTTIRSLVNAQGEMIHSDAGIKWEVLNYYKALLGTSATVLPVINPLVIKQCPMLNREQ